MGELLPELLEFGCLCVVRCRINSVPVLYCTDDLMCRNAWNSTLWAMDVIRNVLTIIIDPPKSLHNLRPANFGTHETSAASSSPSAPRHPA